ncbi:hypothetical protein OK18_18350 [Chryseobacterium gallinarum]|uniref:Uncharacterized protein n=1 Tax=Chryseobacterium gallinarum TaxID=1324352 RepID=A0A0G3M8K2_CHRGL|nr:hypothetical protein [Chryseobacterium gallinarum]AKK74303.1 hypothetical protein OK18_18350 [Chryseobacterium gallinarum]
MKIRNWISRLEEGSQKSGELLVYHTFSSFNLKTKYKNKGRKLETGKRENFHLPASIFQLKNKTE